MTLADLLKVVIERVKAIDSELTANQMAIEAFKAVAPERASLLEKSVAIARRSPVLAEKMREKWSMPLERFLQKESESQSVEEATELFRKTKQADPVN